MSYDTLTLSAFGTPAGDVEPQFALVVDGETIGTAVATTDAQDYSFATTLADGVAHDVQVVVTNYADVNGQSRVLYVKGLSINGVAVPQQDEAYYSPNDGVFTQRGDMYWGGYTDFAVPASYFPVSATSSAGTTGTATTASTAATTTTATAATPASSAASGGTAAASAAPDVIVVSGSASLDDGVGAHFSLVVDGTVVGQDMVGTAEQSFTFDTTLANLATHDVQVYFDNDAYDGPGEDINLFLSSVSVDGQTIAATAAGEVYHATGGPGDIASSGAMYWDGNAEFSFASTTTAATSPGTITTGATTGATGGATTSSGATTPASTAASSSAGGTDATPAGTAAAYYVATGGADSGDGSLAHPFATLARAQQAMEAGGVDTTYIEGGTYVLTQALTLSAADSGMTFLAAPGNTTVLEAPSSVAILTGASDVTFSGLAFADTGTAALSLVGGSGNTITDDLFSSDQEGLLLTGSSNNQVTGNELTGSTTSAIEVKDGSNGNVIDSNLINGDLGTETGGAAIFLHGASDDAITHNLVENTAGAGIGVEDFLPGVTDNYDDTVSYNQIINTDTASNDSGALYIEDRSDVQTGDSLVGNVISGAGVGDDQAAYNRVGLYLDDDTSGVYAADNVVSGMGVDTNEIHGGDNDTLTNNIFDLGTGDVSTFLLQAAPSDQIQGPQTGNVITRNIVLSEGTADKGYVNYGAGAPAISENLYYDTLGHSIPTSPDSAPVTGNPDFANASGGDYTLGSGSAASQIGFQSIDTSLAGLHPTSTAWY